MAIVGDASNAATPTADRITFKFVFMLDPFLQDIGPPLSRRHIAPKSEIGV